MNKIEANTLYIGIKGSGSHFLRCCLNDSMQIGMFIFPNMNLVLFIY